MDYTCIHSYIHIRTHTYINPYPSWQSVSVTYYRLLDSADTRIVTITICEAGHSTGESAVRRDLAQLAVWRLWSSYITPERRRASSSSRSTWRPRCRARSRRSDSGTLDDLSATRLAVSKTPSRSCVVSRRRYGRSDTLQTSVE